MNGKTIFGLDGAGALLSAALLGVVLPRFERSIGMPSEILYALAAIALVLAAYSWSRFVFADHANPRWLHLLSNLNLSYCLLTLGLLVIHWSGLTLLGVAYFIVEMVVVLALVRLEKKLASGL